MNRRPEVWILANTSWYVFNFRRKLIASLLRAGYRVTVFSPPDDYVGRIEALGVAYRPMRMRNSGVGPVSELSTLARIIGEVRRGRPDVLLSYTPKVNMYAGLASRLAGVPIIQNISGLGRAFTTGRVLRRISEVLYRRSTRSAFRVLFQNEDDRRLFVERKLVAAERSERIPGSGVDLQRFRLPGPRAGGPVRFLLASRMLRDKGVVEFVEAARELSAHYPLVQWRMVGFIGVDNPSAISRQQIQAWCDEGIVEYLGATDRIEDHLAQADCVVLPSYREGLPRSLLEAAAMGLPVITTDTTGCRDTVDAGKTGLLCAVRDVPSLVEAMRTIIEMPERQRLAMGRAGRRKVECEFDEKIVIDRYRSLIAAAIASQNQDSKLPEQPAHGVDALFEPASGPNRSSVSAASGASGALASKPSRAASSSARRSQS